MSFDFNTPEDLPTCPTCGAMTVGYSKVKNVGELKESINFACSAAYDRNLSQCWKTKSSFPNKGLNAYHKSKWTQSGQCSNAEEVVRRIRAGEKL